MTLSEDIQLMKNGNGVLMLLMKEELRKLKHKLQTTQVEMFVTNTVLFLNLR